MESLKEFKEKFDREIIEWLNKKLELAKKIDKTGVFLFKVINEFIKTGGKRFRPAIFYSAYRSYSTKNLDKIFKLSFVFELFHTFALIHDDIIDNSDLRRGRQTVHKKYGLATAILVGDLALVLADEIFFEEINKLSQSDEIRQKAIRLYNKFRQEVLIGEYLDSIKIDDINKIMELKTAKYSFVQPAMIGLILAKVDKNEIERWKKILKEVGILFQIKDDFEGIFGNETIIGKPIGSDIKEGKNTLVVKKFLERANQKDKKRFYSFFGKQKIKEKDFCWYIEKLREEKIDKKIKKIILDGCRKTKEYLKSNFDRLLLSHFLTSILENIRNFSYFLHFQNNLLFSNRRKIAGWRYNKDFGI